MSDCIPAFAKRFVEASAPDPIGFVPISAIPVSRRSAMQIKKHDISHMVELRDGSSWRIWPSDIPKTLEWFSTTEIDVADIDDEICSHVLTDRSTGSQVRVISVSENWPA